MARRFAKVSKGEIMAINEAAFFYPPLFTSPSGDSCIIFYVFFVSFYFPICLSSTFFFNLFVTRNHFSNSNYVVSGLKI